MEGWEERKIQKKEEREGVEKQGGKIPNNKEGGWETVEEGRRGGGEDEEEAAGRKQGGKGQERKKFEGWEENEIQKKEKRGGVEKGDGKIPNN
jgi:hypothetical protein